MSLIADWVRYGPEGAYTGYAARLATAQTPLPAVIVLQEIWGVDEHIQDVTRRLAQAGYAAFAPDLFAKDGERLPALGAGQIEAAKQFLNTLPPSAWRNAEERDTALARLPEHERSGISATLNRLFDLGGLQDAFRTQAAETAVYLREVCEHSRGQRVASVGFCMGGALSAALAVRDEQLAGAVIFYGSAPALDALSSIRCPVLGLYGENDKRITDEVPAFAEAMEQAGKRFDYRIYPDAPHAFFNDTRPSYHVASARAAYAETLRFLQETLS
ncbi:MULTISPECIES: dienelactone hydrolase family protein [Paenibacillus]|uniref:Dienelactone hydrolase family protein n=5 Tax=Paenibacillus validus TaxID=44253 RepID=A0A7X2Z842_9BACL|nr:MULTISPECIES: dienelactone hydrolase family protein [Paenibacillus]MUG69500.1 dienelactone hydrolase family protein [Paenibacillus validus]